MVFPRVLIVSNNSISKSSNTGRTLAGLFVGWPKNRLAQFCVSTTEPDYDVCENYYLLTDRNVIEGFEHFRKGVRCDIKANTGSEGNTIIHGKKAFKTPLKMLARHFIWSGRRWESNEFKKWVDDFEPEIVFVWNSDAMFILDIATSISKERNIPVVMYNTEGYYFFDRNIYKNDKMFGGAFYGLYHFLYKRHFRKMMKRVVLSVHLNSLLRDDYYGAFGGKQLVLYTGSNLKFDSSNLHLESPRFSYLGNLELNRHAALIEIADILHSINQSYHLDIYGKAPSVEIENAFKEHPGICFHGMISYDKVIDVIYNSTILFHAESQEEALKYYLRYGFSTKIADSISSGHPFLMYSTEDIAGAKYVMETGAAWYAKEKEELRKCILSILTDEREREHVLGVAKEVAVKNHDAKKNSLLIQSELMQLCCQTNM